VAETVVTLPEPVAVQTPAAAPAPLAAAAGPTPLIAPAAPAPAITTAALTDDAADALPPIVAPRTAPSPLPPAAAADSCAPALDLAALPDATIGVTLTAPCAQSARVVLRHDGLTVAFRTLPSGKLIATLPALSADATVSARLPDGATVSASIAVPEAATARRIAVQWQSDDAFQLVATNGAVVKLGDPGVDLPLRAAVFTHASGVTAPAFEAEVTAKTCGRDMLAEMIVQDGPVVTVSELTLAMPDCDAVGDILVLNNLLPDMTLAAAD
jgi:hypothetical protein